MDVNSKKPVGLGTNVSFSHGCFVDWASVPAGFDWVVICALRVVATNYQPLKEDPEAQAHGVLDIERMKAEDKFFEDGSVNLSS